MSDEAPRPPRTFPWISSVLALLWLPSGALWMANAQHFGWGFLPLLAWLASFPLLTLVFATLAILETRRPLGTRVRCIAWSFLAAAYGVPMVVWMTLHPAKFL